MVHPSQMICQFVDHGQGRGIKANNNLLMIPYYEYLGGDGRMLADVTAQLQKSGTVVLWGHPIHVGAMAAEHRAWMRKQAERMEASLGGMRAEVGAYFGAIDRA